MAERVHEAIVSQEKLFVDMWYWNGNTYTYQFDENAKIKTKLDTEIIVHKFSLCVSPNVELITSRKSYSWELQEIKTHRQKRIKEKRSNISSRWINKIEKIRLFFWRMKQGCLRLYSVFNKSCDSNSCVHNFANDFTLVSWLST